MIGVLANQKEKELVREFFQLFKTPWEFYRPEEKYDVVLCACEDVETSGVAASLVVVYAGHETSFDRDLKSELGASRNGGTLVYKGERFPIFGEILTFLGDRGDLLREEQSRQSAGVRVRSNGRNVARIGYDLFRELRMLLTVGQPVEHAGSPTVEIHIALLRDLIVESGIPLVEIPPIPEGYAFIACLTHDVDHPSIRQHRWDHTAFGFLYRAVVGSVLEVLKGRMPVRHLVINWAAAAKLPFIYLGLARDFWLEFNRYLDIEKDLDSTFFVLPFKGKPGETVSGPAPRIRASGYGAADIAEQLRAVVGAGREIGLHGIDAWINSASGQGEKAQIAKAAGVPVAGVRMHWLYFNGSSPAVLEQAGFAYDSTVGYNETVGYRAGTTQAYKPINASHLLELPMHIMDTALFYPGYLGLTADKANEQVGAIIDTACRYGGTVTINWHDRSIAPERLWGPFYIQLVDRLKMSRAWCTSAGAAVKWFQARRSVSFRRSEQDIEVTAPDVCRDADRRIPGLTVRVYSSNTIPTMNSPGHRDFALIKTMKISFPAGRSIACQ
jgi:hypothetical protein